MQGVKSYIIVSGGVPNFKAEVYCNRSVYDLLYSEIWDEFGESWQAELI